MNYNFQQELDLQLLRSEKRRISIIIIIFCSAVSFRLLNILFIEPDEQTAKVDHLFAVWMFPLLIILFELICLHYINSRSRSGKQKIPFSLQFLHLSVEVLLPSVIIFMVASTYPEVNVLQSPAILIYFIFIILSTLRLNFTLSFFSGLLAATSYIVFSVTIYGHFNTSDAARAFIFFFSGIAAGLVAREIRSRVNNYLQETAKRQQIQNIFGRQLSTEIVTRMLENNGKIESKKMMVAIMFIDIRNFSKFAVNRSPEEIVQFQNAFFAIVINTITKHHGVVHQFLGDGCMITFGAPVELPDASHHAVNAGMELLARLNLAIDRNELPSTRIGIGIHTGEVVTGNIGTPERQQYSITGNPVILASRIEQFNKQFDSQLLVSNDVISSLKDRAESAIFMGRLNVKGWIEPIPIFKLA